MDFIVFRKVLEMTKEPESSFILALGDYPLIRLMDFFITFEAFDYSLSDISKNARVSWATTCELVPKMVKKGFLIETRSVGRARMFKLNTDSLDVKAMKQLFFTICKNAVDKELAVTA